MKTTNRRAFLKLAAIAGAANGTAPWMTWASALQNVAQPRPGHSAVKAWRTSQHERFQQIDVPVWTEGDSTAAMGIHLDPSQSFQQVLGFGAALTDASCYLLEQAGPEKRAEILRECFGSKGLRFSVARTTIGSSDYSLNAYSYDDAREPDPELQHFSLDHDRKYILPLLREAQEVSPALFYFSSPWSPPAWMKAGDTLLGGSMRKQYFDSYAKYFVKFLKGYAEAGVNIKAVTVQNEVDTDQGGSMPQALWGQEYEAEFVKDHLGPAIEKSSLDTKIWILDHNYSLWGRAVDELSDPLVYRYVDGIAWHGYVGSPDAMTRLHDMFPQKNAYWTEGGPDISSSDYATDWTNWSSTFAGILRNWARCIVSWNLVLDENGKPNIGPFSCGGVVTLNSRTHEVSRSGQYWAFAHYSKLMQRGSRIFASWGEMADIYHVAAENPDGSRVLVITNKGREQPIQCTLGAQALRLVLPPDSVISLLWQER